MTYLVNSTGSNLGRSPGAMVALIGLVIAAIAVIVLWRRKDIYWPMQLVIRYPEGGVVYIVIQLARPVMLVMVGIGLILLSPSVR